MFKQDEMKNTIETTNRMLWADGVGLTCDKHGRRPFLPWEMEEITSHLLSPAFGEAWALVEGAYHKMREIWARPVLAVDVE